MSIIHFDATTASSAPINVVNLDGNPQINWVGDTSATVGWNFTSSGFVQTYRNGIVNTIDSGTDWIIPRIGFTSADYEVRGFIYSESSTTTVTHSGANAFDGNGPGDWYGLGSTRNYRFRITTPFQNEFANASIRFEIRNIVDTGQNVNTSQNDGSTAIIDDGEYSYFIEVGLE